ncbi:MAG TPA: DUF5996 family protein [Stellaceae bacterium]|nr:DUF5996 family protein [Stellaceae bacterium]
MTDSATAWPNLPFSEWRETCATLHLWTQVVGKIRLAQAPLINHWWQVPLYVTSRGLTTSPMPYGARSFQIDFDFVDHRLIIAASDGATAGLTLERRSVADFHREVMTPLAVLGLSVKIWTMPVEIEGAIPFEQDTTHASYDRDAANRFWRILVQCERVFTKFRARFLGKVSPVHFFWGSFDLAVTRFSGRRAPPSTATAPHLANWVMREAYSHEVSSVGFWPGDDSVPMPAFFAYAYPEPPGFDRAPMQPSGSYWDRDMGEFLLPYDRVRADAAPDARLLEFCESTYAATADLARWDRAELERGPSASTRP